MESESHWRVGSGDDELFWCETKAVELEGKLVRKQIVPKALSYGSIWVPTLYAEALIPGSQNVTIFGALVFKEVIKLKWGHSGGPWSNMTGVFARRGSQDSDT